MQQEWSRSKNGVATVQGSSHYDVAEVSDNYAVVNTEKAH